MNFFLKMLTEYIFEKLLKLNKYFLFIQLFKKLTLFFVKFILIKKIIKI